MRGIYKGRLPLFVAKELFPGSGEPVWFRFGRLRVDYALGRDGTGRKAE
jgi:hypothetical protein